MPEAKQDQKLTRLSVNLNAETAALLRSYANHHGLSFTESVRKMIGVTAYVDSQVVAGRTIYISDPHEMNMRELVLL